jgi:hypothetical protein
MVLKSCRVVCCKNTEIVVALMAVVGLLTFVFLFLGIASVAMASPPVSRFADMMSLVSLLAPSSNVPPRSLGVAKDPLQCGGAPGVILGAAFGCWN